jgi:NADPH:quinone reductase-like Zn-dependent oxidoreductase
MGLSGGAFAEYVRAPEDQLTAKPVGITFEQAAALPLAGGTALQGLRDDARLQAGQRLLVNGASGGVGTFAVQIGKDLDAEVTAVCSTRNVELVRSLGADAVVDYTREDFTRSATLYDVVLDLVGNRSLGELRRVLTPTGTLLLSGGGLSEGGSLVGPMKLIAAGRLRDPFTKQRIRPLTGRLTPERLAALAELADAGRITPAIDRTYPLSEVPDAIRYLEQEHARAKVVITV